MTKNKVLIPIDGSQFSLQVLHHVTRFLSPAENELMLLYVAEEPGVVEVEQVGLDELTIYVDQAEASIRSGFADGVLPQVRALEKVGFTVSTDVRFGDPMAEIEKCIADEAIDLVAMTTHGRTGLSRVMYGSVAEHVLHHATVPVLLYRTFSEKPATNGEVFAKETVFMA
ncbi:MAG: universal stress protein [Caldilineaceae bacterium]